MTDDARTAHGSAWLNIEPAPPGPPITELPAALLDRPAGSETALVSVLELHLARGILARMLTTAEVTVETAGDGSRFLGLHYSTLDLTDAEAAYLEELLA